MARKSLTAKTAPNLNLLRRLDKEHSERANDIWLDFNDGNPVDYDQIIPSTEIRTALTTKKTILPSFDIPQIYSNYLLSERLFVLTCPQCIKPKDIPIVTEILTHSDLIPVLIGDYADYPPEVIAFILQSPHMSRHEYRMYRTVQILSNSKQSVCGHCVGKRHKVIDNKLLAFDRNNILKRTVQRTISSLHPFITPDFELIEALDDAVEAKDVEAIFSLEGASTTISALRTNQAFESRWNLNTNELPELIKGAKKFIKVDSSKAPSMATSLMDPLTVLVTPNTKASEYFPLAHQYRDELTSLVDHILGKSASKRNRSASEITVLLGDLNAEVSRLTQSNRYLAYRAAFGFLRTNSTLVGTALVAGTLGLAGSIVGCGATVVAGIAGKVLRKSGRLQPSPETTAFLDGVKKSIRPKLHKLLASYTGVSLPAVQLIEIRREIKSKKTPKTSRTRQTKQT